MSLPRGLLAYDDVREAFDRALEAEKGIKIKCKSHGSAVALRARFNYYRQLEREQSMKVYESDDPRWNRTPYEIFSLQVPRKGLPDDDCLFVTRRTITPRDIEEIP